MIDKAPKDMSPENASYLMESNHLLDLTSFFYLYGLNTPKKIVVCILYAVCQARLSF